MCGEKNIQSYWKMKTQSDLNNGAEKEQMDGDLWDAVSSQNQPFFKTCLRENGIKDVVEWGKEEIYFSKKSMSEERK